MDYPQVSTAVLLYGPHEVEDLQPSPILLTKRITQHQNAKYGCPGGKVDFGESVRDSAERELFEETGLRLKCRLTGFIANCIFRAEKRHFMCVWYSAKTELKTINFIELDGTGSPKSEGWKYYSYDDAILLPHMPSTIDAWLHDQGSANKPFGTVIKDYIID